MLSESDKDLDLREWSIDELKSLVIKYKKLKEPKEEDKKEEKKEE